MKTIGVLGLQGDVSEHMDAVGKIGATALWIKKPSQLRQIDALIMPGGESTTISNLMVDCGLFDEIKTLGKAGLPILGTCAGAILLAKKGNAQVAKTGQKLLSLMDMKIGRNAFGRQRESFEAEIEIDGITDLAGVKKNGRIQNGSIRISSNKFATTSSPFNAIFIRAPLIEEVFGECIALALLGKKIVAARQKNLLATCFHPELTDDLRVHKYFYEMIK
ncbi:MAG: pyridoxal 5'-phosphate synthase glutaminase subunit PdxT [Candidatus Micrarchaeota archaeon]